MSKELYKIVPIVPTDAMCDAAFESADIAKADYPHNPYLNNPDEVYTAAINAAPETDFVIVSKSDIEVLKRAIICLKEYIGNKYVKYPSGIKHHIKTSGAFASLETIIKEMEK